MSVVGILVKNKIVVNLAVFEQSGDIKAPYLIAPSDVRIGWIDDRGVFIPPLQQARVIPNDETRDALFNGLSFNLAVGKDISLRPDQIERIRRSIERMNRMSLQDMRWDFLDGSVGLITLSELSAAIIHYQDESDNAWDSYLDTL